MFILFQRFETYAIKLFLTPDTVLKILNESPIPNVLRPIIMVADNINWMMWFHRSLWPPKTSYIIQNSFTNSLFTLIRKPYLFWETPFEFGKNKQPESKRQSSKNWKNKKGARATRNAYCVHKCKLNSRNPVGNLFNCMWVRAAIPHFSFISVAKLLFGSLWKQRALSNAQALSRGDRGGMVSFVSTSYLLRYRGDLKFNDLKLI